MKQQGSMRKRALWKNKDKREKKNRRDMVLRQIRGKTRAWETLRQREEEEKELYESIESDFQQDYTENDKKKMLNTRVNMNKLLYSYIFKRKKYRCTHNCVIFQLVTVLDKRGMKK